MNLPPLISPRFMRAPFSRVAALTMLSLAAVSPGHAQTSLQWKCSTQAAPWTDQPAVALSNTVPLPTSTSVARIFINSSQTSQVIDGWGGCFNERGWRAMGVLSATDRATVMRALFDPQSGLKLNMGRTPIGSSDYAISLYSLDETAGDYSMTNFSIAQDQNYLIPYIKAALAIRPDLSLWAVPWSPPSWMKSSGSLTGGNIKDDDQTLDALALYFTCYVQAYQAQGINIGMVMPQNEPNQSTNYSSCLWTGVQFSKFIGYHLGPALTNAGLATKIFLGTYNESSRGGYSYWVAPSMQDPQTRPYIAGAGCQWSADETMAETRMVAPTLKLMQSEAECGNTNSNDWAFAEYQYQLAKKWFADGASSNIIWNLVLDQTGLSTGGWAQCSPIVVNSMTGAVTYTPYYYCYKHFSYFVQPGAHVANTYSTWADKIAFANPDGSVVAVIGNSSTSSYPVTLNFNGKQSTVVTLPPHSISTFVTPSPLTAVAQWRLKYFGTSANTGDAADTAAPEGDGMCNLLKFSFGLDPTKPQISPVAFANTGTGWAFTYPRSDAAMAMGVTFAVEWSDTLATDSWSTVGVTESIMSDDGLMQQVNASVPGSSSNARFVRLRVIPQN